MLNMYELISCLNQFIHILSFFIQGLTTRMVIPGYFFKCKNIFLCISIILYYRVRRALEQDPEPIQEGPRELDKKAKDSAG